MINGRVIYIIQSNTIMPILIKNILIHFLYFLYIVSFLLYKVNIFDFLLIIVSRCYRLSNGDRRTAAKKKSKIQATENILCISLRSMKVLHIYPNMRNIVKQ